MIRYPTPDPGVAMRFINNTLRQPLWSKQAEIVRAVFSHRVTVVKACHASGKTMDAACIALTWLCTGPHRVVLTTAPTMRQVKEMLWQEIRQLYHRAAANGTPLGGSLMPVACELHVEPKWKMLGFASDNPINMQGHHSAGGVLVILDEAMGVEPPIWSALQGVLTGPFDRMLAIGNPTVADGPFYDAFMDDDPGTARITISAFDVPNVIERREVIPGLVSWPWVQEMARKYGVNSEHYRARVKGEFPTGGDNQLCPLAWVEQAFARHRKIKEWTGPVRLGCDVARYGPDNSVVADSWGKLGIRSLQLLPKATNPETAGFITNIARNHPGDVVDVRIDADGMVGIYDQVMLNKLRCQVTGMRGGFPAMVPEDAVNSRSEWFWNLREELDPDGPNPIALPPDEGLRKELTNIRWAMSPKGQVRVETKEEMRKRGLHSPDKADAVAYARAKLEFDVPVVSVSPEVGRAINQFKSI